MFWYADKNSYGNYHFKHHEPSHEPHSANRSFKNSKYLFFSVRTSESIAFLVFIKQLNLAQTQTRLLNRAPLKSKVNDWNKFVEAARDNEGNSKLPRSHDVGAYWATTLPPLPFFFARQLIIHFLSMKFPEVDYLSEKEREKNLCDESLMMFRRLMWRRCIIFMKTFSRSFNCLTQLIWLGKE